MLAVLLVQLRFSTANAAARYGFSRFPLRGLFVEFGWMIAEIQLKLSFGKTKFIG